MDFHNMSMFVQHRQSVSRRLPNPAAPIPPLITTCEKMTAILTSVLI